MQNKWDAPKARPKNTRFSWNWLGVVPFFLFGLAFLIIPSASILVGSFQDNLGNFTLQNFQNLFRQDILDAYWLSIQVSLVTAIGGGIFGFLLAYAITIGKLPSFVRNALMTFSGVASNFAGVPLAFAFISTIGRVGFVTVMLRDVFNINIYQMGFNLYSFWGLSFVYMYFQFPLMVLIITPALDGLKKEWREASDNLGGNSLHYWQNVALPILMPSIVASIILLFGNAFGAYATAYALTGGFLNIVPIMIGAQVRGDVLHDPGLGFALAMGMVIIMGICIILYSWLQSFSSRWLK